MSKLSIAIATVLALGITNIVSAEDVPDEFEQYAELPEDKCTFVQSRANEAAAKLVKVVDEEVYVSNSLYDVRQAISRVQETAEFYIRRNALEENNTAKANAANKVLLRTPEVATLKRTAAIFHATKEFKHYARVLGGLQACRKIEGIWDLQDVISKDQAPELYWALKYVPMPIGTSMTGGLVAMNVITYTD